MKNSWFGPAPWAPICDELERVPAPAGTPCFHCEEPIAADDDGLLVASPAADGGWKQLPVHMECNLRIVVGSVGHQNAKCSCFGGTEEDPPGMTKRQAAAAAVRLFYARHAEALLVSPTAVVGPEKPKG